MGVAQVQGGAARHVALRTAVPVLASVPQGQAMQGASLEIRYSGPLAAPIQQGQPVATLRVTIPGQLPNDVPLVAAESVAEANWLQRVRNGVLGLFR